MKGKLVEFYDGKYIDEIELNEQAQRMILVVGNLRKEVLYNRQLFR